MLELTAEKKSTAKVETKTRRLWELTRPEIKGHLEEEVDTFVKGTHHPDQSFHDFGHSDRVWQICQKLLDAPLLQNELGRYCAINGLRTDAFPPPDLEIAFFFFGLTHDLGNAFSAFDDHLHGVPLKDDRDFNLYQKTGAELRSRQIAPLFIDHYLDGIINDQARRERITKLTQHLIDCTVFKVNPSADIPFERLIQTIDQSLQTIPESGEEYLQAIIGLLSEEQFDPKGLDPAKIKPQYFLEFAAARFAAIFPDSSEREQITAATGQLPDHLREVKPDDPRLATLAKHHFFSATN